MKIFINGAAGYVGARLVRYFHGKHHVTTCDVMSPEEVSGVDFIVANPDASKDSWTSMLAGHDVVINLAQYPGYKDFPEKSEEMFNANVRLPLRILDAARISGVKSVILFSSGGIYGSGKEKFHELDKLNPLDFYLATKAMCELIGRKYRPFLGVHIVRPFFIYGPGQRGKLIPNLIENIIQAKKVFLNGSGDGGKINPIYIDDVIALTECLLKIIPGSATVNFAGPDIVSMEQIIRMISEITGIKAKIERRPDAPAHDIIADIGRIREISDIKLTPLAEGLRETIENRINRTNKTNTNYMKKDKPKKENPPALIPPHGGYEELKSYQMSLLVYDGTIKFCDRFIDKRSRTHDQMVQAARSGNKNIAEGSQVSGTSKKTELKLVGVARGSLEELLGDYKDFLRQRGLAQWGKDHPISAEIRKLAYEKDRSYRTYMPYIEESSPEVAANTMLCLINQTNYLLDQQLHQLEQAFLQDGGFTERLYKTRRENMTYKSYKTYKTYRTNKSGSDQS